MLVFEALLERIAQGLDSRAIPYMVIGGQAVLAYGEPRLTRDVDVTLGVGPEKLPAILEWARETGWQVLVQEPQQFVAQTLVLPCQEPQSGIRVDLIFSLTPYERQAIERATTIQIRSIPVRFATVEDLIVLKMVAGRPRDLEDVRGILTRHKHLNVGYIRQWLAQMEAAYGEEFGARFDELLGRITR
ncbi:MAG: nucleotidyl transferase AbiEii/AbiGii toxin family protein [Candidatus Acidiferrales bacterium]